MGAPHAELMDSSPNVGMPQASSLLSTHLEDRRNNLDLLRLISAGLVILGHSYAIVGSGSDPMALWSGSVYSGLFSLHVFFFISGLLVTNSFLKKPDVVTWLFSRALRIIPALFMCMIVTVFVMGTLVTKMPVKQYLADSGTWDYFLGNLLLLRTRFNLPGVFTGNVDHAVNGPLWSLYLEVRLYLFAAILLWLFRGRSRQWLTGALSVIVIGGMTNPGWLFMFGGTENNLTCSLLFLVGALCALWSDKVLISNVWLAVLFVAVCHYTWTPVFQPLFLIFTCYFVLCFGFSRLLRRVHLPGDFSYGLYIYGWPVQQMMALLFPQWPPALNTISSLIVATAIGALSWYWVEKPSLAQKTALRSVPGVRWKLAPAFAVACCTIILTGSTSFRFPTGAVSLAKTTAAAMPVAKPAQVASVGGAPTAGKQLQPIQAFGPRQAIAGKPFNVQQNGLSAVWVQLRSSASRKSSIVFRGRRLDTVVSENLLTASVPNDALAQPGDADIYVVDDSAAPERRTPSVRMTIARPK